MSTLLQVIRETEISLSRSKRAVKDNMSNSKVDVEKEGRPLCLAARSISTLTVTSPPPLYPQLIMSRPSAAKGT
jgi:hypothetical protein